MTRRYRLEPLFALTGWTYQSIRTLAPCNGTEWRTRQTEGVTERMADRLACEAGFHPWVVWPEMGEQAIEDAERVCANEPCGTRFTPTWPTQTYCHRQCVKNASERRRRANDPGYAARRNEARRAYYQQAGDYERARQRRYDRSKRQEAR